jgi:hypothetical protein
MVEGDSFTLDLEPRALLVIVAGLLARILRRRRIVVILVKVLVDLVPGDTEHAGSNHTFCHLLLQLLLALLLLFVVNVCAVLQILHLHIAQTAT